MALKDFVLIGALKGEDEALGFAALNCTALGGVRQIGSSIRSLGSVHFMKR